MSMSRGKNMILVKCSNALSLWLELHGLCRNRCLLSKISLGLVWRPQHRPLIAAALEGGSRAAEPWTKCLILMVYRDDFWSMCRQTRGPFPSLAIRDRASQAMGADLAAEPLWVWRCQRGQGTKATKELLRCPTSWHHESCSTSWFLTCPVKQGSRNPNQRDESKPERWPPVWS